MKLSNLKAPLTAAADGLWIKPGPETGDLEIRVRPYTEAYQTELSRVQAALVRQARSDGRLKGRESYEDLPLDTRLALSRELLLNRLVVDVRGLEEEDGSAVTVDRFRALAMDVDTWGPLAEAALAAVAEATTDRAALRAAAGGNSGRTSGSSPVPAKPPS